MKRQPGEKLHTYFLFIIIFIATVMRLWQFDFFSYSNDELSAIIRLEYDNLGDLIEHGVKKNDFHPAGVQVFLYYWTKIFGTSEFAVRLPFVIAGILAVLFSYLVAKKWFGKNTALFTAAAVAALSYPILYSQIARPYSPGLFFCMAGVYFWSRLIFENQWKEYKNLSGYILFSTLAAYTHHFSFLFMIIVGATGLFLIKRRYLKTYLLAALVVFILYLPHLPVFLYQFG
ncbi:MAG: glycosyltransferase family 39 protein, partial [Bacteroidia bacterium]